LLDDHHETSRAAASKSQSRQRIIVSTTRPVSGAGGGLYELGKSDQGYVIGGNYVTEKFPPQS